MRTEQVKLLGYSNLCNKVFAESAVVQRDELDQLIADVTLDLTSWRKQPVAEAELAAYLSPSKDTVPDKELIMDDYAKVRFRNFVTLDGALEFLFQLSRDLIGLSFEREEKVDAWNPDVRLYHAFDDDNDRRYVGSFYLDAFRRPDNEKLDRSMTTPIFPKGPQRQPVVAMCLQVQPPAWDTDPASVSWKDCESLFHEFGHLYAFLLSKSTADCVLGPRNTPLDVSEFVAKVCLV